MPTVKKIIVKKLMSDEQIASKEGEYFPESYYKNNGHIINFDCDVYKDTGELLLKFRKNVIPKDLCKNALESFREASQKKHENRGAAAGVLDRKKLPNYVGKLINKSKFRTGFSYSSDGRKSKIATSNLSKSNIAGYFDIPDRNKKGKGAPCRLTAFNRDHVDLWNNAVPYIKQCDRLFKQLVPKRHKNQLDRARQTPEFVIDGTAFSTLTLNYSWRTALHRDKGDFKDGFGNLLVIEDDKNINSYRGCYIGFPQFGVCVDVRTCDFLAMDVHEWHSNTEFKKKSRVDTSNFKPIDIENDWYFNRLSIVMYLRHNMIRCNNKELWKNKESFDSSEQKKNKQTKLNKIIQKLPQDFIKLIQTKYTLFD